MEKTINRNESRYINLSRVEKSFSKISLAFFFTLFVLPQYFGVPFPLFDFTVLRIMMLIMLLIILGIKQKQQEFLYLIANVPYSKILLPYVMVLVYTAMLRVDVNAFLNPMIELISFYLLIYVIKNSFGIKKTIKYIIFFSYILATLGLVEYVFHKSPFIFLKTIEGLYTPGIIRSGYYRIMGPSIHALGYGLILITIVPIICYDIEKEEINILRHKLLFIMVAINVFFTGSRSTLGVFLLEVVILVAFSTRINKKKLILTGSLIISIFAVLMITFQKTTAAQYILLQITSVIDEVLGTTYSLKYGADINALGDSSSYRDQLIYVFQVDWLNPLLGMGRNKRFSSEINGFYVKSIDSFYVAEYIRYAYPGMIFYIAFLLYFIIRMLKNSIIMKSQICKMLFTGSLCYCINILWLDSLQTLKYLYILFAIFCCLPDNSLVETNIKELIENKKPSKYIK